MLAKARKTIERFDFDRRTQPKGYRIPFTSLRMARKLSEASITVRLELIRIGLLRSQLRELYRIKNILEKKVEEDKTQPDERRPTPRKRQDETAAYYTPIKENDEEDADDLIPVMPRETPQRQYPRQSIGQWSVERAKNNMSVRSLISSLEVKRR